MQNEQLNESKWKSNDVNCNKSVSVPKKK